MSSDVRYAFGPFRLVPSERALYSGRAPVRIGARAFDVLLALIERRDRTVPKSELLEVVWPKRVVEENNLEVQVAALRKALGPPAIATIPGRGYRFAQPVEVEGAPKDSGDAGSRPDVASVPPARTNLPPSLPALFGRDADVAAVRAMLSQHAVVTIVGAGGIGKTRVAQAAGVASLDDHRDGVYWVELASVSEPALVPSAVAIALGVPLASDRDPTSAVVAALRGRKLLLILDNCEHVADATSAFVDALRAHAPEPRVLATSQEVLRTRDEALYRLPTLALPPGGELAAAAASGAVALFVARAKAVAPRFTLDAGNVAQVVEICRRLDGIPLAIELAAARVPLLGVAGLRDRLDARFSVLTAGSRVVLRRHQTLRAALEWSHSLLTPDEQVVFRRVGVFAGTFTLEAAQRVASGGGIDEWSALERLGGLVDKSLVLAEGDAVPRYRLLETTRVYALERLAEAGETDEMLRRHAQALVRWLRPHLAQRIRRRLDPREEEAMQPEIDNVRAALDWAARCGDDELALSLAGVSWIVFAWAEVPFEGWQRLLALRDRVHPGTPPEIAAQFWSAIATLGRIVARHESYDAALREVELTRGLRDPQRLALALIRVAAIGARRGEVAVAQRALDEAAALERDDWPPRQRAGLQWARHRLLAVQGRYDEAMACALRQAQHYREEGWEEDYQQALAANVAECELNMGRLREAEARVRGAFAQRAPGSPGWGHAHEVLATVLALTGRHDEALEHFRLALDDLRAIGDEERLLEPLALLAASQGRLEDAATVAGYVDAEVARSHGARWPPAAHRRAQLDALLGGGLDAATLAACKDAGATLTEDDAFALLLEEAPAKA